MGSLWQQNREVSILQLMGALLGLPGPLHVPLHMCCSSFTLCHIYLNRKSINDYLSLKQCSAVNPLQEDVHTLALQPQNLSGAQLYLCKPG